MLTHLQVLNYVPGACVFDVIGAQVNYLKRSFVLHKRKNSFHLDHPPRSPSCPIPKLFTRYNHLLNVSLSLSVLWSLRSFSASPSISTFLSFVLCLEFSFPNLSLVLSPPHLAADCSAPRKRAARVRPQDDSCLCRRAGNDYRRAQESCSWKCCTAGHSSDLFRVGRGYFHPSPSIKVRMASRRLRSGAIPDAWQVSS